MKYKEWLDVWFANYIEPSSKTKTCERYSEIIEKHLKVKLGEYEQVSSYIGYLFGQYQPYMWWVLLATAGVWSIVMGVFFAIAQKNEDKEKARKMIKNYVI